MVVPIYASCTTILLIEVFIFTITVNHWLCEPTVKKLFELDNKVWFVIVIYCLMVLFVLDVKITCNSLKLSGNSTPSAPPPALPAFQSKSLF